MCYLLTEVTFLYSSPILQCLLSESLPQLLDSPYSLLDFLSIPFTLCGHEKHTHTISLKSLHVNICHIAANYLWYVLPFLVSGGLGNSSLCLCSLCDRCCARCYLRADNAAKSMQNTLLMLETDIIYYHSAKPAGKSKKLRWKPVFSPLSPLTFPSSSPMTDFLLSVRKIKECIQLWT